MLIFVLSYFTSFNLLVWLLNEYAPTFHFQGGRLSKISFWVYLSTLRTKTRLKRLKLKIKCFFSFQQLNVGKWTFQQVLFFFYQSAFFSNLFFLGFSILPVFFLTRFVFQIIFFFFFFFYIYNTKYYIYGNINILYIFILPFFILLSFFLFLFLLLLFFLPLFFFIFLFLCKNW